MARSSRRGSKSENSKSKKDSKRRSQKPRVQLARYPSIDGIHKSSLLGQPCIAFEKHDGSNLQFSWNQTDGWYRYGTRKRTVEKDNPLFGSAIEMFHKQYADGILQTIRKYKEYRNCKSLTAFCEFLGDKTFSGLHVDGDPKRLVLFDILVDDSQMVLPKDFVAHFGNLDIAKVLYEGELSQQLIDDVRTGKLDCNEGVVCKGVHSHQRRKGKTEHEVWMVKIKTEKWMQELQRRASDTPDKFDSAWQENNSEQSGDKPEH